ncbi:MAG TPA: hypothetical protein VKT53_15155 [Candidatus Acidoferrum sp.]|nr:hypothetical protein [Candidatus Acidoferrum sp.]
MSLIGLVNLAEKLFNQTQGNSNEDTGPASKAAKGIATQSAQAKPSDEFRPSAGNPANEAGLFQVSQASVFTAAASVLLVQGENTAPAAGPAAGPAATTKASDAPVATTNTNTPPAPATNTETAAAPAATTNVTNTGAAQIQTELQSLNAALAALGLNTDEIAAIDRVAQLIKDFSPAAFTSLVSQLKVLAQDTAQPAATAPANTATTGGATGGTQAGGFSIQQLSINFAGINETVQKGGNTLQISAFQLQVSEVNLTLNNGATGQTATIQAPQAATPATTAAAAPIAKSAAA